MSKRLVYAEDALAQIEREKAYLTDVGYIHAKSAVNSAPTVDAKPVVHGRWICLEPEIGYFACSECDHRILRAKCNYCPNCGADMRGYQDEP